ncbi:MAG: phosphoribosylanthranilate isomerase [Bryobacterales bacterium]|nr:phosphoribosylanthranilate isomerase [Bryobacterales bacterium]
MRPSPPALRKVCGVTSAEDAIHAATAGANAIGMIFYPPSPRSVDIRTARDIAAAVPAGVLRVGVFVNEPAERVAEAVRTVPLDAVQLHGDETPAECREVQRSIGAASLWKAFRVGPGFDPRAMAAYAADAFLLDTAHDGAYGGTGKPFAWHRAVPAMAFGRVILAGGLDGSNAAEAVRAVAPWGVDASSRLEVRPGHKDPERVERYLAAVT